MNHEKHFLPTQSPSSNHPFPFLLSSHWKNFGIGILWVTGFFIMGMLLLPFLPTLMSLTDVSRNFFHPKSVFSQNYPLICQRIGLPDWSLSYWEFVTKLHPKNSYGMTRWIEASLEVENYPLTLILSKKLQTLEPHQAEGFLFEARALVKLGQPKKALELCQKILEENPEHLKAMKLGFYLCHFLRINWEGIRLGEQLVRKPDHFQRDEFKKIGFLLSQLKSRNRFLE